MKNESHIVSSGWKTHQDSSQKSGLLWRILFHKSCLRRILFDQKIRPAAHFSIKIFLNITIARLVSNINITIARLVSICML